MIKPSNPQGPKSHPTHKAIQPGNRPIHKTHEAIQLIKPSNPDKCPIQGAVDHPTKPMKPRDSNHKATNPTKLWRAFRREVLRRWVESRAFVFVAALNSMLWLLWAAITIAVARLAIAVFAALGCSSRLRSLKPDNSVSL
jgi:hypothetical protein